MVPTRTDRRSSTCSPYFPKRQECSARSRKRSSHFLRSPSSPCGSVRSLGSWTRCLTGNSGVDDENETTASPLSREEAVTLARALRHFECCPEFMKRWSSERHNVNRSDSKRPKSCRQQSWEERLSDCVRHLCPYRCYMRAFAPYRDWHALRFSLVERFSDCNVDEVLMGWSCTLLNNEACLPRTTFLSPQGDRFASPQQVMRHLCTRGDGQRLDYMKIFYESSRPSIRQVEGFQFLALRAIPCCDSVESPFGLLEELFTGDPWRLLLSTILLNRTTRRQVDPVMHEFLLQWPDCLAVLNDFERDDEDANSRMAAVLQPLGMNLRRTAGILRFCHDYHQLLLRMATELCVEPDQAAFRLSKSQILQLFHCGEYASSAYRIFIQRRCDFDPGDHALTMYAEYQNGAAQSNLIVSL